MGKEQLFNKVRPATDSDPQISREGAEIIERLIEKGVEPGDAIECGLKPEAEPQ